MKTWVASRIRLMEAKCSPKDFLKGEIFTLELEGFSFCFVVLVLVQKAISQSKAILAN
jgi:hypothetical protein